MNTLADRVAVLESFDFVDYIVSFYDDDPLDLIQLLKPDIFTKGANTDIAHVVGNGIGKEAIENYGGIVELIPEIRGVSSTSILTKCALP